jgi:hypothetical protein
MFSAARFVDDQDIAAGGADKPRAEGAVQTPVAAADNDDRRTGLFGSRENLSARVAHSPDWLRPNTALGKESFRFVEDPVLLDAA